jgi:hypothetical protein
MSFFGKLFGLLFLNGNRKGDTRHFQPTPLPLCRALSSRVDGMLVVGFSLIRLARQPTCHLHHVVRFSCVHSSTFDMGKYDV